MVATSWQLGGPLWVAEEALTLRFSKQFCVKLQEPLEGSRVDGEPADQSTAHCGKG